MMSLKSRIIPQRASGIGGWRGVMVTTISLGCCFSFLGVVGLRRNFGFMPALLELVETYPKVVASVGVALVMERMVIVYRQAVESSVSTQSKATRDHIRRKERERIKRTRVTR